MKDCWAFILGVLLLQFFLRADRITAQPAFIDEAYHVQRSVLVWQFTENPGQFSNGKLLLYYWLGLFQNSQGDRSTALFVSRTAIALFSLISGAAVYRIGADLINRRVGLLALTLYAILPLAIFHERMALADPFAGGFACLVVWRSLIFARRPHVWEGALIGVLLALAMLAKLTMALLPLLPVLLSIAYVWQSDNEITIRVWLDRWRRTYFWPLTLAALIVILAWLPLLIPAYAARYSAQPFVLVNEKNIDRADSLIAPSLDTYLIQMTQALYDYLGVALPIGGLIWIGLAVLINMTIGTTLQYISDRQALRLQWFVIVLGVWILCLVAPTLAFASQVTARYLMPISAPLAILLAWAIERGWRCGSDELSAMRWLLVRRAALIGISGGWLIAFAIPFAVTAITAPDALPLSRVNAAQYLRGVAPANGWVITIAADLNRLARIQPLPIYGEWEICNQLYFYAQPPMICFPRSPQYDPAQIPAQIRRAAKSQPILLVLNTYQLDPAQFPDLDATPIERFPPTGIPNEQPSLWRITPLGSSTLMSAIAKSAR